MGENENYLTYCSLRSQSCLKDSAKWVNEAEWVSKVKVILWPWSKVTQISKLNVWLLACILRWAIQGLLALLFLFLILTLWCVCLIEMVKMSHNICFYAELTKVIHTINKYSLLSLSRGLRNASVYELCEKVPYGACKHWNIRSGPEIIKLVSCST